jgi:hypothetical protein
VGATWPNILRVRAGSGSWLVKKAHRSFANIARLDHPENMHCIFLLAADKGAVAGG